MVKKSSHPLELWGLVVRAELLKQFVCGELVYLFDDACVDGLRVVFRQSAAAAGSSSALHACARTGV